MFVRGTIFTGGGGGGSFADLCEATGAIGPGGAWAKASPVNNKPAPPKISNLRACLIAFFPEGDPRRGIPLDSFPQTLAKVPGLRPASFPFVSPI
jgi:hypothetical protein